MGQSTANGCRSGESMRLGKRSKGIKRKCFRLRMKTFLGTTTHDNRIRDTQSRLFVVETPEHTDGKFIDLFDELILLFTGFPASEQLDALDLDYDYTSAIRSGGLYFYIDILRAFGDKYDVCSSIHIGRGCIESSGHTYDSVLDSKRSARWEESFVESIVPAELLESSPGELWLEAVAEDHIKLSFSYRVRNRDKTFEIGPTQFLRCLGWSYHYKSDVRPQVVTMNPSLTRGTHFSKYLQAYHEWLDKQDWKYLAKLVGVKPTKNNLIKRCLLMCENPSSRTVLENIGDIKAMLYNKPVLEKGWDVNPSFENGSHAAAIKKYHFRKERKFITDGSLFLKAMEILI